MRAFVRRTIAVILALTCILTGFSGSAFAETALPVTIAETAYAEEAEAAAEEVLPDDGNEAPAEAAEPGPMIEIPAGAEEPAIPAEAAETEISADEAETVAETEVPAGAAEPALQPDEVPTETEALLPVSGEAAEAEAELPESSVEATRTTDAPAEILPEPTIAPSVETAAESGTAENGGETILVFPETLTIEVGQTAMLRPAMQPDDPAMTYSFSTPDDDVVRLLDSGVILGQREGLARITATAANGLSAQCLVVVMPAGLQEEIYYNHVALPATLNLIIGESHQLVPEYAPENANSALYYSIDDPTIASVDANGLVKALAKGDTNIRLNYKLGSSGLGEAVCALHVATAPDAYAHNFTIEDGVLISYSGDGGEVVVPDGVRVIAGSAFAEPAFNPISRIILPDSVTHIGDGAFRNLSSLVVVRLPEGLQEIGDYAFYGLERLVSLKLPDSVTRIGDYAFSRLRLFWNMELPASLQEIGASAFAENEQMTFSALPAGLTSIGPGAFSKTALAQVVIPSGVREIPENAFSYTKITSITIPGTVESIGDYAFSNCEKLKEITIEEGVRRIGTHLLLYSPNVKNVYVPASVAELGEFPFYTPNSDLVVTTIAGSPTWRYCLKNAVPCSYPSSPAPSDYFEIEDGVLLSYLGNDGELVIPEGVTAIAPNAFFRNKAAITSIRFPSSLRTIGDESFYNFYGLKSIEFKEGLESIGTRAFYYSGSLTGITLPDSLHTIGSQAFYGCEQLRTLHLGSGLSQIGEGAFGECKALEEVNLDTLTAIVPGMFSVFAGERLTIPENIRSIGAGAFQVSALQELVISEGVERIGAAAFARCYELRQVTLPASLIEIAPDAFYNSDAYFLVPAGSAAEEYCKANGLPYSRIGEYDDSTAFRIENGVLMGYYGTQEHITIPAEVHTIGNSAFDSSSRVKTISFHSGITRICEYAFHQNAFLEEALLPEGLITIEANAFYNCSSLKRVTLPSTLRSLGRSAFYYCQALESVEFGEGLEEISSNAFSYSGMREVRLPDSLQSIGDRAFSHSPNLVSIHIPDGVKTIGNSAFFECRALESVDLPAGLTRLADSLFRACTSLKRVSLPEGLQRIESQAFYDCASLRSLYVPNGATELGFNVFYNCEDLIDLYIPASVVKIASSIFYNCPHVFVRCAKGSAIQKYCANYSINYTTSSANPNLLRLPEGNRTLGVGQSYSLKVYVNDTIDMGGVSFKSSDAKRVAVDAATGVVTALKTGSATITVSSGSGITASCKVTVIAAPRSVTLSEEEITLAVGESFLLTTSLPNKTAASMSYASAASLVSVSQDGLVTAVSPGEDTVTVTTHNGKLDSCIVHVLPAPTVLILDRSSITLRQTTSDRIIPSVNPESICRSYSYASSDPAIVSVDADGGISAVGRGTAIITVTTPGGLSAECRVTVIAPPPNIVLPADTMELGVKESYTLVPSYEFEEGGYSGSFSFASKNSRVASVDANGVITALRTGSTVITVTSEDGQSASCAITVRKAPSKLELSAETIGMGVGEAGRLTWTLSSKSASIVRLASSNPEVLEVAPDGSLTAVAPGTATVTASTFNGKNDSCSVTVYAPPTSMQIVFPSGNTIGRNMKGQFSVAFGEGEGGSVRFSSGDTDDLIIDPVTGAFDAVGEALNYNAVIFVRVEAESYNGLKSSKYIYIEDAPRKLAFTESALTLGVGDRHATAISSDVKYDICESYKSSNSSVVSVDENGVLTAKKAGSATITVTSYNGLSARMKVTVRKAAASLELLPAAVSLGLGERFQLTPVFYPKNSTNKVHYASSNPQALEVDAETGMICALQDYGIVTVTATTTGGATAQCSVQLNRAPKSIYFPKNRITVPVGAEIPFDLRFTDGTCSSLEILVEEGNLVRIDSEGRIFAKKKGTVCIDVRTYNFSSARLYVTIVDAPKKYSLNLPKQMQIGDVVSVYDVFKSSPEIDPSILIKSVSVNNKRAELVENELGVFLLPVEEGNFTLTVKTFNGKSIRASVKVAGTSTVPRPEYSAPVDMNATMQSYIGKWTLKGASDIDGVVSLPPEMLGIENWTIEVSESGATVSVNGVSESTSVRMDGSSLLLDSTLLSLACIRRTNGWMAIPLEEDVVLWFAQ